MRFAGLRDGLLNPDSMAMLPGQMATNLACYPSGARVCSTMFTWGAFRGVPELVLRLGVVERLKRRRFNLAPSSIMQMRFRLSTCVLDGLYRKGRRCYYFEVHILT